MEEHLTHRWYCQPPPYANYCNFLHLTLPVKKKKNRSPLWTKVLVHYWISCLRWAWKMFSLQRWWRSVRSIDEEDDDYDLSVQEGAALCLQKHWRGYRARQRFRLWRAAALVLQRAWRFWLRRRCTAALVIQAAWRCHRAREADLRLYAAVIQLQAVCKGFLTRRR